MDFLSKLTGYRSTIIAWLAVAGMALDILGDVAGVIPTDPTTAGALLVAIPVTIKTIIDKIGKLKSAVPALLLALAFTPTDSSAEGYTAKVAGLAGGGSMIEATAAVSQLPFTVAVAHYSLSGREDAWALSGVRSIGAEGPLDVSLKLGLARVTDANSAKTTDPVFGVGIAYTLANPPGAFVAVGIEHSGDARASLGLGVRF